MKGLWFSARGLMLDRLRGWIPGSTTPPGGSFDQSQRYFLQGYLLP